MAIVQVELSLVPVPDTISGDVVQHVEHFVCVHVVRVPVCAGAVAGHGERVVLTCDRVGRVPVDQVGESLGCVLAMGTVDVAPIPKDIVTYARVGGLCLCVCHVKHISRVVRVGQVFEPIRERSPSGGCWGIAARWVRVSTTGVGAVPRTSRAAQLGFPRHQENRAVRRSR